MTDVDVRDEVARWMGILSSGMLIGEEAERSALRARRVLGGERLRELRAWFDAQPPAVIADAKVAIVEAVMSIACADSKLDERERELAERIIDLAELDEGVASPLRERISQPPELDAIVPRIPHPSLRELVLVMAWQMATVDGHVEQSEHGAYGVLADRLGITPVRAQELRALFRGE